MQAVLKPCILLEGAWTKESSAFELGFEQAPGTCEDAVPTEALRMLLSGVWPGVCLSRAVGEAVGKRLAPYPLVTH